jgi:YidC/Oxa1 family membrane protein insertase
MNFFTELNSVQNILNSKYQVVVYAESRHYYQYFESLLDDLLKNSSVKILYITSDKNDPVLKTKQKFQVVYVKQFLGFLFPRIKAEVMIMTMPDLNNFLFKRSTNIGKYVYVFHAAVSTHLQYREKAFFYYDTIFCTGPHQLNEIREAETIHDLPPKELIPYGYPLLDSIKNKFKIHSDATKDSQGRILVAPSWFDSCIFETCIEELVTELAKLDLIIYVRAHPEYIKRSAKKYKALMEMTSQLSNVYFDENPDVIDSIVETDLLITDRSGIALEYAFGTYRPVLFIDTPLKISNPNWQKLSAQPVENELRDRIGLSVLPNEIPGIGGKISQLINTKEKFRNDLQQLEQKIFFNSHASYQQGLDYILRNLITG